MSTNNFGERVVSGTGAVLGSAANATSNAANAIGDKLNTYEPSTLIKILRLVNLMNAIGLVAAGVVNLITIPVCTGSACLPTAIISVQLVIFGVLLFCFESRFGVRYDAFYRRQCGFLYGQWGRLFFILFLASLCFGILYTTLPLWWVQTLVGGFTIINAILNCFIIRHHPGFQFGGTPTEGIGGNSGSAQPRVDMGDDRPAPASQGSIPSAPYGGSAYAGGSAYSGSSQYQQGFDGGASGGKQNPFSVSIV